MDTAAVGTKTLNGIALAEGGGWAVGTEGALLRLTATGWTRATAPSGNFPYTLTAISLVDANNGWAVGTWNVSVGATVYTYGMGLKLANGVWSLTQNSLAWGLSGVDLADANNGWAVGNSGQLVQISNGVYSPGPPGSTASLRAVALSDARNGWAAGGRILRKLVEGVWSNVVPPALDSINAMILDDAQNGWAVGTYGTVWRLSAGAWTKVPAITDRRLNGVVRSAAGTVWAVGDYGTVLRKRGETWEQCSYGTASEPSLNAVSSSAQGTIAVGTGGHRRKLAP
ncbi:MAG: WD40/YVTN/BNR-like repeat-containing protein [Myxococcaceae bacterium]